MPGISDSSVQEKLLNITKLDLQKTIEIAKSSEIMKKQLKEVQQQEKSVEAVKIKYNENKSRREYNSENVEKKKSNPRISMQSMQIQA